MSRPLRRLVLLVDDNTQERSCTKLFLETTDRYRVLETSHAHALTIFHDELIELALIQAVPEYPLLFHQMGGLALAAAIRQESPRMPLILFSRERVLPPEQHAADWFFDARHSPPATLLEHMKIMLVRKRGVKAAYQVEQRAGGMA